MIHSNSTNNHILENWTYADAPARRAATGLVSADVGKIAYQTDLGMYFRLTATTPTWQSIGRYIDAQTSAQGSISAATRTYVSNSKIKVGQFLVGSRFQWVVSITKTAAGTSHTDFDIAVGTLGTTGDTARVTFTGATETNVADTATVVIDAIVRVVSGSGVVAATLNVGNSAAAGPTAGYKTNAAYVASSTFSNSADNLFIGLCITPGTGDTTTLNYASLFAENFG